MGVLIAITSGFASGVFARSLFYFGWAPIGFVLVLAALVGAAAFLKPRVTYTLGAFFFLFCALGMVRAMVADTPLPSAFVSDLRHRVAYDGVVVGDPDVREKNQRIALVVEKGSERVGALAVMPLSAHVAVGDRVRVYGTLYVPQAFETDNGRTFRYDKYLQARGERFLIEFGTIYTRESAPWYSVPAALARVKHTFLDGLDRALAEPYSALAGGIVIGGKSGLGTTLQDAFTKSGLVQIIVLSGYNVMIVAEWVMIFFSYLRLPRRLQYFAGGAALLLFVGIAGISATAVRATLMAVIALYARATGHTYAASRALLVVVLLMLVWNPLSLCFDPGFDLSVAATAGIIWLSPIIERWLVRLKERARGKKIFESYLPTSAGRKVFESVPSAATSHQAGRTDGFERNALENFSPERVSSFWVNAVATTIAAQLSVLPLLLYNSGLLSLVALPANLLVNPLMPLAMAAAAIAGVTGMLFGSFAPIVVKIVGLPVLLLTHYIIFIAEKSAALPYATLLIQRFPFALVLLAYVALIALSKRFSITDQLTLAKKASI